MPKRANPFGDCSPLQYKTHIGKKEVDMGVCQEQNMRKVYERTKDLLFKGAQKQTNYEIDSNANQIECQPINMECELRTEPLPGQMCFDGNCQLTRAPFINQSSHINTNMSTVQMDVPSQFQFCDKSPNTNICCHCNKSMSLQAGTRCNFCDKRLCFTCKQNCDSCTEVFCQMCSVMNYDESMERVFCFNCSK